MPQPGFFDLDECYAKLNERPSFRLHVISTKLNSKKMPGKIILKIGMRSRAAPFCAFGGLLPTSTGRRRLKTVIGERLAPADHH